MSTERRAHSRVRIDAVSKFLIEKNDKYEGDFEGYVHDISEEGIGVLIPKEKYFNSMDTLKVDDCIFFQAFDEYTIFNKLTSDIFQGKTQIVRINETDDGFYLGCKIVNSNHDLQDFISRRKMAFFIDGIATPK